MNTLLLTAPILVPLLAAAGYGIAGWRPSTARTGVLTAAVLCAAAVGLAVTVFRDGPIEALGGQLRADALSAWMLLVVALVAMLACWASPGYLRTAQEPRSRARGYGILLHLFVAAMTVAVLAGSLGVLWAAVEATTVVTAFLVGHSRSRTALEAAWKYVVICSAAIAVAFLGTVLLYYAARHAGLSADAALDWPSLTARASELDPTVTRVAIGLAVIGFGAKAGLVPLHAWLPDAHSQAPAPVSALMSGVLLSVGFYAVLRYKVIADAALGPGFLQGLLIVLALATLAVAALLLFAQRDYKRMLAYSSMEHMGLLAIGTAVGTRLALAAVLLHVGAHGLAKTVAFLGSGHVLHMHGTSRIADVRGLLGRAPVLAGLFALAVIALLGLPPSAVFSSEIAIARAGFASDLGWAVAVAFVLVLIAFAGLASGTGRMLLGPAGEAGPVDRPVTVATAAPMVVGLVAVGLLGITAGPLGELLRTAAGVVGAAP